MDMFAWTISFENLLAHTHFIFLWTSGLVLTKALKTSIMDVIKMQSNLLDDEVSFGELSEQQEWPSSSFCRTAQACLQNISFYPELLFLCAACGVTYLQTRKHSSRMRTARLLTGPGGGGHVSGGIHPQSHTPCLSLAPGYTHYMLAHYILGIQHPLPNRMTNRTWCKNTYLPTTSFAGGNYNYVPLKTIENTLSLIPIQYKLKTLHLPLTVLQKILLGLGNGMALGWGWYSYAFAGIPGTSL